jgi:hypothetical protein
MRKTIEIMFLVLAGSLFIASGAVAQNDGPGPDGSDRPEVDRPPLPAELREKIVEFKTEQHALRSELRTAIGDTTEAEKRAIVEAFREANVERIADQRELGAEIRAEIAEIRGDREVPDGFRDRVTDFRHDRRELQIDRREFVASLEGLSEEDRETAIQAFKEEYRERLHDLKEARRDLRDDVNGNLGGNRRPGE